MNPPVPRLRLAGPLRSTAALRFGRSLLGAVLLASWWAAARADPAADIDAARQAYGDRDFARSDSLAGAALAALEAADPPDSVAIAAALGQIGWSRWQIAGFADGTALRATRRAHGIFERHLGPDHLEVANTHFLLAQLYRGMDEIDSAAFHGRKAVEIRIRAGDDPEEIAEAWYALALLQRDALDYRGALDSFDEHLAILKRLHGPEDASMVQVLTSSGRCLHLLGDTQGARERMERALAIVRASPDHRYHWMVLDNLASLERSTGNLALAFDRQKEAVERAALAEGGDSRAHLTLRGNLGVLLNEFGDFQGARSVLEPLIPLREAHYGVGHPRALNTRLHLAIARIGSGDTAAAVADLEEIESRLGDRPGVPEAILSLAQRYHALVLFRQGRLAGARSLCERAIRTEASRPEPHTERLARNQFLLIEILAALGNVAALDSAARELDRIDDVYALRSSENGPPVPYYAARAALALDRREEALELAREAEQRARERLLLNLRALPDRRALEYVRQQTGYLALVLDLSRGDASLLEQAWDRLVRSRGLVRAELTRRRLPAELAADADAAGAHHRWIEAQRRLAQSLVNRSESGRDSLGAAGLERLRADAEDAEGDYVRVLADRGARIPGADVGWDEVRAALAPDQALVSFVEHGASLPVLGAGTWDDSVMALVVRGPGGAAVRVDLGSSEDLRVSLDAWRGRIAASPGPEARAAGPSESECRRLGSRVRARTWDRIAPYLGGVGEVFVVGDGPLLDVPWGALPDGETGYLVEAGPTVHLLNAERELVERMPPGESGSLLALGAPDYDTGSDAPPDGTAPLTGTLRSTGPCDGEDLPSFVPLPGSGAEARAVAGTWAAQPGCAATVLTGAEAGERAFKSRAPGHLILHLATHGMVTGEPCASGVPGGRGVGGLSPLPAADARPSSGRAPAASPWLARRVWLALAGANRARDHRADENEGILTAEEVLTLDLTGTDWVVLSACHSGLAEAWQREGAVGMRRAFDLAGARTVIASQWAVEDAATLEWMTALYGARSRGTLSAARAVEAAGRSVLAERRRSGRSTHPFYWAAFTASGE